MALRFNLRELFAITGVIAFGTVSLLRSDQLYETLFFSFTLLVILTAFLLSIAVQAGGRVFWIAFAATSSLYLGLAHVPDSEGFVPRHYGPEITTQLLLLVYNWPNAETDQYYPGGAFSVQDDPFANGSPPAMPDKPRDFDDLISDVTEIIGPDIEPFPPNLQLIVGGGQRISDDSVSFMRIGHSAWALLIGWIAGHFTRAIYERSRRDA